MSVHTSSKPDAVGSQPSTSHKRCIDCKAQLVLSDFGIHKRYPDGYQLSCKLCRSQYNSLNWTKKHGRRHKHYEPEIIRIVAIQNDLVLTQVLSTSIPMVYAFDPVRSIDYRIHFGKSERLGLDAMAIFDVEGRSFIEHAYSSIPNFKMVLLGILKQLGLRLELTEADLISAKATIYYL